MRTILTLSHNNQEVIHEDLFPSFDFEDREFNLLNENSEIIITYDLLDINKVEWYR